MKQRARKETTHATSDGTEGSEAALEDQLSEAQLKQASGGVFSGSPFASKLRPPTTQWSGEPYRPEEDVEAY